MKAKFTCHAANGDYQDYEFEPVPDNLCVMYRITHNLPNDTWYGTKRVSETPDGAFDDGTELNVEDVNALRALIHPSYIDGDFWYTRQHKLECEQVYRTYDGSIVKLDRRVPGDGTRWYVANYSPPKYEYSTGYSYEDDTIEPCDLRERLIEMEG